MAYTLTILQTLALTRVHWDEENARIAVAIAMRESSLNPGAHNPKPPDDSFGLMQLNMFDKLGPPRRKEFGIATNEELFDPATNMRAARMVYKHSGWNAWSTYRYNKYLAYMPQVNAAADSQPPTPPKEQDDMFSDTDRALLTTINKRLEALETRPAPTPTGGGTGGGGWRLVIDAEDTTKAVWLTNGFERRWVQDGNHQKGLANFYGLSADNPDKWNHNDVVRIPIVPGTDLPPKA